MQTYFPTLSAAIEEAISDADKKGYTVDQPFTYDAVNYGTTAKYYLDLRKDGKLLTKKCLVIVLYRMDSGTYELTSYID